MKTLTVNIQIQFDKFDEDKSNLAYAQEVIDRLNDLIRSDGDNPQLLSGALDDDDISEENDGG